MATPGPTGKTPTSATTADASPPRIDAARTLRRLNPPLSRRLLVALCFPLFILAAAPYWWATTSITRLALPKERIGVLEHADIPPLRTQVLLTGDASAFPPSPQGKPYPMSALLGGVSKLVTEGADWVVRREGHERTWDLTWKAEDASPAALRVHIKIDPGANTSFPLEPYILPPVGAPYAPDAGAPARRAEDGTRLEPGTVVIPVSPQQVRDHSLRTHYKIALINAIHGLLPPTWDVPNRALAYAPNVTLSFVLLNEEAGRGGYVDGWDVEAAIRDHFQPHLDALAPVHNFSIESQVLYHAPLTFEPVRAGQGQTEGEGGDASGDDGWVVDEDSLKTFVSERWSLDSQSSNNPVLRFLLYVPSAAHRPLRLAVDGADSFLIPQSGSVVILNPPPSISEGGHHLALPALDAAFAQFQSHLFSLLALPEMPEHIHPFPPADHERTSKHARSLADPLSPWQLDTVLRARLAENSREARTTLAGIVRLVDKIEEMKIEDEVRDKVRAAVGKLEALPAAARSKSPLPAFRLARDAVALANDAFFDPGMMGLLYFPDQHKFAVYTPLFAPIGVSILAGLFRELMAWRKRRATAAKGAAKDDGEGGGEEAEVARAGGESVGMTTATDTRAARTIDSAVRTRSAAS